MKDLECPSCGASDWEVYDTDGVGFSETIYTHNECLVCGGDFRIEYEFKRLL